MVWKALRCNKPEKGEQIVDRIKESAKCLDNIKCQQTETVRVGFCSKTTTVLLK